MDDNYQRNNVNNFGTTSMNNNITGISIQQGNINGKPPQSSNDITGIENTSVYKEANQAREQALDNQIAGVPWVENVQFAETQPDLSKSTVTQEFNTRDEIMAKVGLMDENYKYTDTYSNYIANGGQIPQGYEWAHTELLKQEGYDHIFQKEADGLITHDEALMEAYGRDILAQMGYDINNVGYWQKKFASNDFSSPFTNQYVMDQVKQLAEEWHTSRQVGQFANTQAKDTQLASLIGVEADELSSKKLKELFPKMEALTAEMDDDTKFMKALHNGQIGVEMRMAQDSKGTWYYLHTDGKVYCLDGKNMDGHGTLNMKGDEFESIDLNNSGLVSGGRNFLSGFAKVFTSIVSLGAMVLEAPVELAQAAGILENDDELFSLANAWDGMLADDADWLVGTGYVDLNGDISLQDGFNFFCNMAGTIAGTMTLAGFIGAVGDAGTATSAATKGTGLIGYGENLVSGGHTITGNLIKGAGTALKWQTGNIGSLSAAHTANGIWMRRFGAAAVSNLKNGLNDWRRMSLQAQLYEDGASQKEIMGRVFMTTAFNFAIDSLISGGMDDNQLQAYKAKFGKAGSNFEDASALDFLGLTNAEVTAKADLIRQVRNATPDILTEQMKKEAKSAFTDLMKSRSFTIGFNSMLDLTGNMLTGAIGQASNLDDEGKLVDAFSGFKNILSPEVLGKSLINTLWYSTRSQIKEWNVGLETLGKSHTDFLAHIDSQISKAKDPQDKQTLVSYKMQYLEAMQDPEVKDAELEVKIYHAMAKTSDNMGGVPEALKNIVTKNAKAVASGYYKSLYTSGLALYEAKYARLTKILDPQTDTGHHFFNIIHNRATSKLTGFLTGRTASDKATMSYGANPITGLDRNQEFINNINKELFIYKSDYVTNILELTKPIVDKEVGKDTPLQVKSGYDLLKGLKEKEQKDLVAKIGATSADEAKDTIFMQLPNEGERTKGYNIAENTLKIMVDMGYARVIDEKTGLYAAQKCYNFVDIENTAGATKAIYNTVVGLQSSELTVDQKSKLVSDLGNALITSKASDIDKSRILSEMLWTLTNFKGNNKGDGRSTAVMSLAQAGKIYADLVQKNEIVDLYAKGSKSVSATTAMKKFHDINDIMTKIQKDQGDFISLVDPDVMDILERLKGQPDGITEAQYNKLMKIRDENPESFIDGNRLENNKGKLLRAIQAHLQRAVPDERFKEEDVKDKLNLYLKTVGVKDINYNDPIFKAIQDVCTEYDNIIKDGKTVNLSQDNILYIDLNSFRGKRTVEFTNKIINEGLTNRKNIDREDAYKEFSKDLAKEFKVMQEYKWANENRASMISFDLNTTYGRETLSKFLSDMGYKNINTSSVEYLKQDISRIEGLKNFFGDSIVLDLKVLKDNEKIKDLKDALLRSGELKIGNQSIKFSRMKLVDQSGSTLDIERALLDFVDIQNIDPSIKFKLKQAPLLQLFPFTAPVDGKYDFTSPMAAALFGPDAITSPDKNSGKMARLAMTQLEHIMLNSAGSKQKLDNPLATYFTLDIIAQRICSGDEATNIPLSDEEARMFKEAGIIDYNAGLKHITNDNNIWELVGSEKTKGQMLTLKAGVTLDKLREYIVSKDFNVYRMLPLNIITTTDKNKHGLISRFQTYTTKGIQDLPSGMAKETGISVLDIQLPWDDEGNRFYGAFIKNLVKNNKGFNYNPLEGTNFSAHKSVAYNSYDDWYEKAEKSNDPYDILTKRYVDEFYNMSAGKPGQQEYNNEDLLIFCRGSRKVLLDAIKDGGEITEETVNKVKNVLRSIQNIAPEHEGSYITKGTPGSAGIYSRGYEVTPDEVVISPKAILQVFGDNNIEFDNIDWIDLKTVQKAVSKINDVTNGEYNDYRTEFLNSYIPAQFEENNATRLLKGYVGNSGEFLLDDIDSTADLLFEDWRSYVDASTNEVTGKPIKNADGMLALKYLYGKEADAVADKILHAAAKQLKFSKTYEGIFKSHYKGYGQPSITEGPNDGVIVPKNHEAAQQSEFMRQIEDDIARKQSKEKNMYSKIIGGNAETIRNDISDAMDRYVQNSRMLYTAAPANSESENIVLNHNAIGEMKATFNTYDMLKENFKDISDDKAMDLAAKMVSLNRGVDYASDTVKWMVINDDYSFKDGDEDLLEKYGSANPSEFLFNIHKAQKDLMGKTILYTEHQSVDNPAAIKMSYMKINNEEALTKLTQDLYHYFLVDNSYYLTNQAKTVAEKNILINDILRGKIPHETIQTLLQKIPSNSLSRLQEQKDMYDIFKQRTGIQDVSRLEFNGAFKAFSTIDVNNLTLEAAYDMLKEPFANVARNEKAMSGIMALAFGLGKPEHWSDEKLKAYHTFQDEIAKLIPKEDQEVIKSFEDLATYQQSPEYKAKQAKEEIFKYLSENDDIYTIDYTTRNNRSLAQMYDEIQSGNVKKAFVVHEDENGKQFMDTKDMEELLTSLKDDYDGTPNHKVVIAFDTETTLLQDKKVLTLGLVIKKWGANGWETTNRTIYLDYNKDMDETNKRLAREELVRRECPAGHKFRKDNAAYEEEIQNFIKASGEDLMTPDAIKAYLTELIGENNNAILLGFNSASADIPWLKDAEVLDDKLLSKLTHIDVRLLGQTGQVLEGKPQSSKDAYAKNLNIENLASHGSMNDADVTLELFKKVGALAFNVASLKDKEVINIQRMLSNKGIELDGDTFRSILKEVDSSLDNLKEQNLQLSKYFDTDYEVNSGNVAAATDIFEYTFNKLMADMSWAIKSEQIAQNVYSEQALNSLSKDNSVLINKIWTAAEAQGRTQWDVANAFKKVIANSGICNQNTLLEVLNDSNKLKAVMNIIGISQEDIDNIKDVHRMYTQDPSKDPEHTKEFETYDLLKGTYSLYGNIRNIVKAIGVKDLSSETDLLTELTKFYAIRQGADTKELFKDNIKLLDTKLGKIWKQVLDSRYGDEDAIVATYRNGLYDLIDSIGTGTKIYNGLTGKRIEINSSMVVISPEQFKNLTGISYKEYVQKYPQIKETGLYSQLLVNPADGNDKILPRQVIVNPELTGAEMMIPETVLEVLAARDVDGDHLSLLSPDIATNGALKVWSDNIFATHDIQERMLAFLKGGRNDYSSYKDKNLLMNTIGRDATVMDLCYEADGLLESGKYTDENLNKLTTKLEQAIRYKFKTINKELKKTDRYTEDQINKYINKFKEDYWIQTKNLYEIDREDVPVKYIGNKAIQVSKDDDQKETYSARKAREIDTKQRLSKPLYNVIDQITGVAEKSVLKNMEGKIIKNPWTDLLTSNIYGSKLISRYLENFDGTNETLRTKFIEELNKGISNIVNPEEFKSTIKQLNDALENGENRVAFNVYDKLLREVEQTYIKTLDKQEIVDALTSPEMQKHYEVMQQKLQRTSDNLKLRNEVAKLSKYWGTDFDSPAITQLTLKQGLNEIVKDPATTYNINIFNQPGAGKVTGFNIIRFSKLSKEELQKLGKSRNGNIGIAEDTVLYNNKYNDPLVGMTKHSIEIKKGDKVLNTIVKGQKYKAGTVITEGTHPYRLNHDAYISYKDNSKVVITEIGELDNNFKITTNFGGKGVLNSTYSTDEDIAFLINKGTPNKVLGGYNKPLDTKEETIILYDSNGNPIKAIGYRVPEMVYKPTEVTEQWDKNKERKIDLLHIVTDANSINSFIDFGGTYSKEEGLKTNPEKFAELQSGIYNMSRDYTYANGWGTINKIKMMALLNVIGDTELQQVYKTQMEPSKLRDRLLNNTALCTKQYTDQVYTLYKKFGNRLVIDDSGIINKLFDDKIYNLIGGYKPTANAKNLNLEAITGKSNMAVMANTDSEGNNTAKMSRVTEEHPEVDVINMDKGLKNHEEINVSMFKVYDYLFDGKSPFNEYEVSRLMREGKLSYAEFVDGTPSPDNNFRGYDTRYTQEDTFADTINKAQENSAKTMGTTTQAEYVNSKPRVVDLTPIEDAYVSPSLKQQGYIDPRIMNLLINTNVETYNNTAKVSRMLYQLLNMNNTMSQQEKIKYLSDTKNIYGIFDQYLGLTFDEDGNLKPHLAKNVLVQGDLNELNDKCSKTIYNYTWYNTVKKKQDAQHLDDSYIKPVTDEEVREKARKEKAVKEELNSIYTEMKEKIYNDKTGEIKDDVNFNNFKTEQQDIEVPKVLSSGEELTFKTNILGRNNVDESTEAGAAIGTALKNVFASSTYFEQEALANIANLEREIGTQISKEEFDTFAKWNQIIVADKETQQEYLTMYNTTLEDVQKNLNEFVKTYPSIATKYAQHVDYLVHTIKKVAEQTGESYDSLLPGLLAPYVNKGNTKLAKGQAFSALTSLMGMKKYSPIDDKNKKMENLGFDFFNSSKAIIKNLSKMQSLEYLHRNLVDHKLIFNDALINNVEDLMNKLITEDTEGYIGKTDEAQKQLQNVIFDEILNLTNMKISPKNETNLFQRYKDTYLKLKDTTSALEVAFNNRFGKSFHSYTEFENFADSSIDVEASNAAKAVANHYYAKMICAQGMIEGNKDFANKAGKYIQSLKTDGYCLVNKYGQKYVQGGIVDPISAPTLSNLIENAEIQYNSRSETMFNQFILEKIISGEIYLMKNEPANLLEQQLYTQKYSGPIRQTLSKVSKYSCGFQMALPSKILNRLISFTGFDYSMGFMYDPKVVKYIGQARREIMAAYQSKGTQMSEDLKQYMMREGQPVGLTGKDPVTFSEDFDAPKAIQSVLDTLTDPLEIQNHLGRYAIYLTALEGFRNGDPNYGPLYYAKDAIDKLGEGHDEDKAMMVMDYMLGSPNGGFPELAKRTSGLMMYATFPLNFARTMGAYGMSLGKLFKEGFTEENSKQWMRSAIRPSLGLVGISIVGMLFTNLICELLGVTGKEKDDLVYDLSTIDLVGTALSGKPQKSGSSMNPAENIYSMLVEPITNVNNDTLAKKLFGYVNANILGHLNPAIKTPIEVATGYDFFGSSLLNTKYSYNAIENGTRKALGFVIGSNTANSIVDQYKLDKYSNDRDFLDTLKVGTAKGIAASLGNGRSYKKDTTTYYNVITSINNYKKKSSGSYDLDVQDFIDANKMEKMRSYTNKYGTYNPDDYKRVSRLLRKAIDRKEDSSVIYGIIMNEYKNGVDEATLKSVLNNHSVARKLNNLNNKEAYLRSLSTDEYNKLVKALRYEEENYPLLKDFFPDKHKLPTIRKTATNYTYNGGGSGYYSPRTYSPKKAPQVNYYPNNGYSNKKISVKNPKASINKVNVEVSPQMGVWTNDYNKVVDLQHWKDQNYNRVKPMNHGGGK